MLPNHGWEAHGTSKQPSGETPRSNQVARYLGWWEAGHAGPILDRRGSRVSRNKRKSPPPAMHHHISKAASEGLRVRGYLKWVPSYILPGEWKGRTWFPVIHPPPKERWPRWFQCLAQVTWMQGWRMTGRGDSFLPPSCPVASWQPLK